MVHSFAIALFTSRHPSVVEARARSPAGYRQARQQRSHPRNVPVFLTRAVGVAEHHLVDPLGIKAGGALHGFPDHVPAMSSGRTPVRPEPNLPNAVRTASYTKA